MATAIGWILLAIFLVVEVVLYWRENYWRN